MAESCCVWAQAVTRKTRVLDVVYNASNNELVRSGAASVGEVQTRSSLLHSFVEEKRLRCSVWRVPFTNEKLI